MSACLTSSVSSAAVSRSRRPVRGHDDLTVNMIKNRRKATHVSGEESLCMNHGKGTRTCQRWCRYTVPTSMTVIQWVADFSERIKQLQQISQGAASGGAKELKNIHVCLGSLFVPEAYITATRQYVAQANSWSLEELCLEVSVTTALGTALDACSFGIKGLKLQGATCANNKLSLSTSISTELPLTQLRWIKQSNAEKRHMVTLPVYLNFTRSELIFTVDFDIATKEDPHSFYERGVAILCTE
ncbi:hypothetical protein F2P81_003337 [Scophthalmus maximus]|uniref:Dynein heavy chain C-terminal domain-containing protein n=1 Tax=Scophthalmus maximus TaxID=52904 RepID=A0A6A4TH72_SCOMX|nr:hypothetical protein F2P81_003337 [Scophthalmus maximus]